MNSPVAAVPKSAVERAKSLQSLIDRHGPEIDRRREVTPEVVEALVGNDMLRLLLPRRLDPVSRFDLQERLAARLHRDVDLLDLAAASTVMAVQIVTAGRVLYDGAPAARGEFEDRTLSLYARLNEERRGILERVAEEGTIYGR